MKESAKAKLFSFRYFVFDFIKLTGAIPTLIWLRPKRIYAGEAAKRRIRGGALVIANHSAFIDPLYVMTAIWYRRVRFVFSEELARSRAGGFFRACGCMEIDRQNPTLGSFKQITDALKGGEVVTIFPEGHLSGENGDAFKSGAVLMALRSGVPIVPLYICPRKMAFGRLKVVFGEAVDIREIYGERPTFAQIGEATKLLYERQTALRERFSDTLHT